MGFLLIPRKPQKKVSEEIDYDNLPEADVVVNYLIDRQIKGLGTNIFVIGLSGTGKSSQTLRLAELYKQNMEERDNDKHLEE
jgi:NH3-dependent NAD+ synthetase